jgi:hypothetical protein
MSNKTSGFQYEALALVFNNQGITSIGDGSGTLGSSVAGSLYFSLHTGDPTAGGSQITNEITYTSYARVGVLRQDGAGGFTITGTSINTDDVEFPTGTGGSGTATHYAVGTASSGAGRLLYTAALITSIACGNGVTPIINAGGAEVGES